MRVLVFLIFSSLAFGTTGNVVYTGTTIAFGTGAGACSPACPPSNAFDGDFTTPYFESTQNVWVGTDFGAAITLSAVRLTHSNSMWSSETSMPWTIQGSTNNNTWTTILTGPAHPLIPMMQWKEYAISPSQAYRYYRFTSGWQGSIAEIEWIGTAGQSATTRPIAPLLSPMGGSFSFTGTAVFTISSGTTSAVLHYTTDGSAADCSSTTYSSPVSLLINGGVANGKSTVSAIACDAGTTTQASRVGQGIFRNYDIAPSDDWLDSVYGNPIENHAGYLVRANGKYYVFGQFTAKPNLTNSPDTVVNDGVYLYSTVDLVNYTPLGQILDNTSNNWNWIERPRVIFNVSTNKWVLWAHGTNSHGTESRAVVATADNIEGPWTYVNASLDPDGLGLKDFNLFVDDDGTGYVVYVDGAQDAIYVSQLASDYLSAGISHVKLMTTNHESPVLFKRGSVYFFIQGAGSYYDASVSLGVQWATITGGTPLTGTLSGFTNFYASDVSNTVNNGQQNQVILLPGGQYLYGADHFNKTVLYNSRTVWFLLNFPTNTSMGPPSPLPDFWSIPPRPIRHRSSGGN